MTTTATKMTSVFAGQGRNSNNSNSKANSDSSAVLVTGPRCSEPPPRHLGAGGAAAAADRDFANVEPERYETVDVSAENNNTTLPAKKNPLLQLFENASSLVLDTTAGARQKDIGATELKEMSGRVVSPIHHQHQQQQQQRQQQHQHKKNGKNNTVLVAGDFDTCREYQFQNDEVGGADDCGGDDDDEDTYDTNLGTAPGLAAFSALVPPQMSDMMGSFFAGTSSSAAAAAANMHSNDENVLRTYCLGKSYHPIHDYTARRDDESSLFWFTYRCDFPEIAPYNITSDAGWGCMLRSAQMLLAQAIRLHYKSRDWKPATVLARRRQDPFVRSVLTWFADFPSTTDSVYSLHNMVAAGLAKYEKLPGEWYGPGTACYVLRDLVELHERQQQRNHGTGDSSKTIFRVHVAGQGTVYKDVVEELMTRESKKRREKEVAQQQQQKETTTTTTKQQQQPTSAPAHPLDVDWEEELVENNAPQQQQPLEWDTALLLLIPLRLGLNSFNEDYVQAVAHTFSLSQSVGVLGGRPRGARWFYGALSDGSKIFGLDPHTVQTAPCRRTARVNGKFQSVVELSEDYMRSVHTTYPEVFCLSKMDPSIALGFYCKTRDDFHAVLTSMAAWQKSHPDQPELFAFADRVPNYASGTGDEEDDMMMMSNMMMTLDDRGCGDSADDGGGAAAAAGSDEEDEYVML